jgi:hypothetical protein
MGDKKEKGEFEFSHSLMSLDGGCGGEKEKCVAICKYFL